MVGPLPTKPHHRTSVNYFANYTWRTRKKGSTNVRSMENYPLLAEALAETIEELRLERGLTKTALADFAALQRFYLLNIEKKTNRPTANALFFICDALSIRPSDFFLLVEQKMERMREEARTAPQPALKRAPSRSRTKN